MPHLACWCLLLLYVPRIWADISVMDDAGREVRLVEPAERIISLSPHNTENLFSAGAGSRVVGVIEYSDHPPAAQDIQVVGDYVQQNLELITSLEPDLIVVWQSGNSSETTRRLENLGYTIYISEPRTFQDIVDNVVELAVLSGTQSQMDPGLFEVTQKLKNIRTSYAAKKRLSVFYQVWTDPLSTLNGDHMISKALEVCNARNIFADLPMIAPRVNLESIVQANPDVIMTAKIDEKVQTMPFWKGWEVIRAVREENYVYVDADIMYRHTLRMLREIPEFCKSLDRIRSKFEG